jgi:hypothetical protein
MKLPAAGALLCLAGLPLSLAPSSFGAKKSAVVDPTVFGRMSGQTGCVIFAEGHKTNVMFWGVAVSETVRGKLTVLETQNYTLQDTVILETQENMNALMQRAQKDNVKFVTIPEKHTPDLLDKARAACKDGMQ